MRDASRSIRWFGLREWDLRRFFELTLPTLRWIEYEASSRRPALCRIGIKIKRP